MEITLASSKEVIVIPSKTKTVDKITITQLIDKPIEKVVVAMTKELGHIELWSGASYDNIGQWTDTDVANKIQEIYS